MTRPRRSAVAHRPADSCREHHRRQARTRRAAGSCCFDGGGNDHGDRQRQRDHVPLPQWVDRGHEAAHDDHDAGCSKPRPPARHAEHEEHDRGTVPVEPDRPKRASPPAGSGDRRGTRGHRRAAPARLGQRQRAQTDNHVGDPCPIRPRRVSIRGERGSSERNGHDDQRPTNVRHSGTIDLGIFGRTRPADLSAERRFADSLALG